MIRSVAIVGPTAAGKTEVSLRTAADIFEIISADSVQVYRYMDIGSSKPSAEEMKTVRHHMVDIVNPDYHFTAGEYCIRALRSAEEIVSRGKMPLIVGGTGFYINSLLQGIHEIPDIDESVKKNVENQYDNGGLEELYLELQVNDPDFAAKVHRNDRQRVVRGITVLRSTGRPLSSYFSGIKNSSNFDALTIGLFSEKDCLYQRIDRRVDSMIKKGLVDEVIKLRSMGYAPALNSMQSIGYSEINRFIDGSVDFNGAIEEIKKNTKKYAKKQMTWFRKNKNIIWFSPEEIVKIPVFIERWIN